MKKFICLTLVLMLCVSLALPVFATQGAFVPSISEKDGPTLVPTTDETGKTIYGRIMKDGKMIGYIEQDCLVITPVSQAETSTRIPADAKAMLLSVYEQLKSGSMKIPYEKFSASLNSSNMVIRELVDLSWLCQEHPEMLEPQGVTIELIFDLGVSADTDVYVMTYKKDEWNPIVKTTNNGDGTVTCEFEDFCPAVFSVRAGTGTPPAQTGDNAKLAVWIVLMSVAVVGVAAMFVLRRKSVQKNG